MINDFATNARVDKLRDDLLTTERLLRDRDDEKERGLRAEFVAAVHASEERTHGRLDQIDEHLTRQDEFLLERRSIWPNWRRMLVLYILATVAGALMLHYGFHLP